MKNLQLLLIGILFFAATGTAQVAINQNAIEANESAILDVQSTSKGMLIPRMSQSQRNSISNPAQGLLVFIIEENSFYFFNNSTWEELGNGASGWELQNSIISTDSLHQVIIGNNSGSGIFEVVTDKATGTYTADQCTNGTATAQENATGKLPSNAFDNDNNTYWSNDGTLPVWLQYYFGADEGKVIAKYRIYYQGASYESSPKDWNFQASNDGTTWTTINSQTNQNWVSNSWKEYTFTNTTRYEYYRISITDNQSSSDDFVYISEMEMQEMTYSNHSTLFVNENKVGIGTASPQATLHIDGTVKFTDGNESSGKILTSDASGNATWEDNAAATNINGLSDGKSDVSNLFIGSGAGNNNNNVWNYNTGIGIASLGTNTNGSYNTATGSRSLTFNGEGDYNTAHGAFALYGNSIGSNNVASGAYSLYYNKGNYNTGLGAKAGYYNETGSNNTIIGFEAGKGTSAHNKSGNIFLGYQAGYNETGDNKLYIENSNSDTPLIGGDFENDSLFFNGIIRITGGSPGADKILTSDEDGNATWETPQWGATEINGLSDGKSDASSLFLGNEAGLHDDGDGNNTGIGAFSLQRNTTGTYNTATGTRSLMINTEGHDNSAHGTNSLLRNTTGNYNVASGSFSLYSNTTGFNNVGVGSSALYSNLTSTGNTAVGAYSFRFNQGYYNTGMGTRANYYNETGNNNTIIGYEAGKGTSAHNKSGNIFLGYKAGYSETGSNKLYIENSSSTTPLIGGDFDADEVYFNTNKVGIGTSIPREILEVASRTNSYGRMIVSDGGGNERNVLLFVSPTVSNQTARIEGFNYDSGTGVILNFNTVGNASCVFGGNVLPESHISKNIGADGQAWNNVYAHNYVTQGSAAFADTKVTKQLIDFPPVEKQAGAFDEFTEKGLKELDPSSLPESLKENNAILIDEMTTYNYKANYEQQLQIEELKNDRNQQKQIDFLTIENNNLKERLERLEKIIEKIK